MEKQKGVMWIKYGDRTWEFDVPFNDSAVYGDIKNKFNGKELFLSYLDGGEPELLNYLKKFDVFTRAYGQKINFIG